MKHLCFICREWAVKDIELTHITKDKATTVIIPLCRGHLYEVVSTPSKDMSVYLFWRATQFRGGSNGLS